MELFNYACGAPHQPKKLNEFGTSNNVMKVKSSDFRVFEALALDSIHTGHLDFGLGTLFSLTSKCKQTMSSHRLFLALAHFRKVCFAGLTHCFIYFYRCFRISTRRLQSVCASSKLRNRLPPQWSSHSSSAPVTSDSQ
jgi:hypothetical protein